MRIKYNFIFEDFKGLFSEHDLKMIEKQFNLFISEKHKSLNGITKEAVLDIYFISDEQIKEINKEKRAKDKATDVLSWKMYEEDIVDNMIFGEILISNDYVKKQANKKGINIKDEIYLLVTHGFLHVCGYTHENDNDELAMNIETLAIMKELGIDYSMELI